MSEKNLTVSEIDPNDIVQQPKTSTVLETVDFQDTVIVQSEDVNDDVITITIRDDELPDAVLKAVLMGLSEEQNSLRSLRIKKEREGKDMSHLCIKRGTLLKYMSETLIQKQALVGGSGEIDLKGPKFREIIKMFLNIITGTFDEIKAPGEYRDLFFHALQKNLEGWELRAEKIIKTIH